MEFKITNQEGRSFAKLSGDNNLIHLDDIIGYNSLFGEKICHGCLVMLKFFDLINLNKLIKNKEKYLIKIIFLKHFSYEKKIKILKKKNYFFFYQSKILIAELKINYRNKFTKFNLVKKQSFKIDIKKNKRNNNIENLSLLLRKLSMFVGTIFPGEDSIIRDVSINYNKNFYFSEKKIDIFSKKLDSRYPIINNKIVHKNYNIEFQTLIRPSFNFKGVKINKKIKNITNNIKDKILIIGAGSGMGRELLDIFKLNSKLKIIATYYKNKILIKNKNIKIIKLDIEKSINKVKKIINNFNNITVYYFATPKINLDIKDNESLNQYKRFYIKYPLEILSSFKGQNIKFFYPSTVYVNKIKSTYAEIKKNAELKLRRINKKNITINLLRIDEVNTKQNISLSNKNLPTFTQLVNKNKQYQNKIFFIK
jgi:hypothetical protein